MNSRHVRRIFALLVIGSTPSLQSEKRETHAQSRNSARVRGMWVEASCIRKKPFSGTEPLYQALFVFRYCHAPALCASNHTPVTDTGPYARTALSGREEPREGVRRRSGQVA